MKKITTFFKRLFLCLKKNEMKKKSPIFRANLGIILVLAFGLISTCLVYYYNLSIPVLSFLVRNSSTGNSRIEYYKFFGLMISGLLLLWQAILAGIRTEQGNKNVEIANENVKIGNKNIEIQINNAIEERFKNAISLIGSDNAATRLGAIYALDHIAKDTYNKEKSYTKTIFQILCSYIRETTNNDEYKIKFKDKPSVEIQTIIDLLFKSHLNNFNGYIELQADLSYSYLCGADFNKAHCKGANFSFSHCEGSFFESANCEGSFFWNTHCEGANFCRSHCEGADFRYSHCAGATFFHVCFKDANFVGADCSGTSFGDADCAGVNFLNTNCEGADFIITKNLNLIGSIGTPKNILKP